MLRTLARRRNDNGFTLIELLIVIVILGILAAIVAFSVRGITDRGDTAACKAEIKTLEVAVEAFYAKDTTPPATYPGSNADLVTAGLLRSATTKYANVAPAADGSLVAIGTLPAGCTI